MKAKYLYIFLAIMFLIVFGYSTIGVAKEQGEKSPPVSTGLEDQTGVAVTIYNVNLGLVKDLRNIKLPKGTGEVRFMDVASQIIPTSVHIKSLINPHSLQVLEQNYEYDLLNNYNLMPNKITAYEQQAKIYQKKHEECSNKNYTQEDQKNAGCMDTDTLATCSSKLFESCRQTELNKLYNMKKDLTHQLHKKT